MSDDEKAECKYGDDCYQKNAAHLKKYKHSNKRPAESESENDASKKSKLDEDEKGSNGAGSGVKDSSAPSEDRDKEDNEIPEGNANDKSSETTEKKLSLQDLPLDEKLKALFLVEMPKDFYEFYDFCKSLNAKEPKKALAEVGLTLVGPYDVLDGQIADCTLEESLRHYRYYYDPPEFQTVLKGDDSSGEHYGYFRDDPKEAPVFVGRNDALKNARIDVVAGDLFSALNLLLERKKKTSDPFKKMKIRKVLTALSRRDEFRSDKAALKNRLSQIVAKTFHGAGIIVPFDKKTQVGYRELTMADADLKKLLKKMSDVDSDEERTTFWDRLQPVITSANIACDESDFGTSLELGLDLFCFGSEFLHDTILQQLTTAYTLLKREEFIKIINAHLKKRTKDLSQLNTISL